MNKEITVTLTEKSHKHAEMMINLIANPSLTVMKRISDSSWCFVPCPNWNFDEYFMCQPEYVNEYLHWLHGGGVEFRVYGNEQWSDYPRYKEWEWGSNMAFMREGLEFRIKQDAEYVKVLSVFDLKRDEQYYCNSTGKSYDPIGQHPSEQYLVAQLEQNNIYRKVEK